MLTVRMAHLRMQANRDFARRSLPLLEAAWRGGEMKVLPVKGIEPWLDFLRPKKTGGSKKYRDKIHPLVKKLRKRLVPWAFGCEDVEFESLIGTTSSEFREYIAAKFLDGMTWETHGYWHLDHIEPVSSFDHNEPEQVKACWIFTNFQPLWGRVNSKKGKKLNYGKDPDRTNHGVAQASS